MHMHKRVFAAIITIAVALAAVLPSAAHAAPCDFTDVYKVDGITYAVAPRLHAAAVVRLPKRANVTIPAEVRAGGKWYEVRAVWDHSIPKSVKSITIHADLETAEDARLWKIDVRATRRGVFKWLRATGAHVKYVRCPHCR
jgi:hypothetical protein